MLDTALQMKTVCQADRSARGSRAHNAAREHERYKRRRTLGSRSVGEDGRQNPIVMILSLARIAICMRPKGRCLREGSSIWCRFGRARRVSG
jgi:hypothetical protein